MTAPEWVPVPGHPDARMVDSETHPPIYACDIAAANELHARHVASHAKPQVRPHAENRTSADTTTPIPGTLTGGTSEAESASEGFLDNFGDDDDE